MSTIEVDKIIPQSGTNLTVGEAGDSLVFQNDVIPNSALVNEQITINGVAVNLGGSATIPTETQPTITGISPSVIDASPKEHTTTGFFFKSLSFKLFFDLYLNPSAMPVVGIACIPVADD